MHEESYKLTIEGITPLLMEKYINKDGLQSKGRVYEKEWMEKAYVASPVAAIVDKRLEEGKTLVIPHEVFKACIQQGARGLHRGRVYYTKFLPWGLRLLEFESPIYYDGKITTLDDIDKNETTWVNEYRRTLDQKTSVWTTRPMIPTGWTIKWNIQISSETLTQKVLEEIFDRAGKMAGMGGQRPSSPKKPGSFGQFKVKEFKKL